MWLLLEVSLSHCVMPLFAKNPNKGLSSLLVETFALFLQLDMKKH